MWPSKRLSRMLAMYYATSEYAMFLLLLRWLNSEVYTLKNDHNKPWRHVTSPLLLSPCTIPAMSKNDVIRTRTHLSRFDHLHQTLLQSLDVVKRHQWRSSHANVHFCQPKFNGSLLGNLGNSRNRIPLVMRLWCKIVCLLLLSSASYSTHGQEWPLCNKLTSVPFKTMSLVMPPLNQQNHLPPIRSFKKIPTTQGTSTVMLHMRLMKQQLCKTLGSPWITQSGPIDLEASTGCGLNNSHSCATHT